MDTFPSLHVLRIQLDLGSALRLTPNLLKGLQKVMTPENIASSQGLGIKNRTTDFVCLLPFLPLEYNHAVLFTKCGTRT